MLDNKRIAAFIFEKRRQKGLTQQQIAEKLNVSFQAVSKWENGSALPNIELLPELSKILGVSVDELLSGCEKSGLALSYSKAGVDTALTDKIKSEIAEYVNSPDLRVLNGIGQFASLYDIKFNDVINPVLVLKSEEPGSKQKLAFKYGYINSICHDMINHLVNYIAVMGAKPLAVLDTIICGSADKEIIKSIVKGISEACRDNECALVGGETSIQPNFLDKGVYILTSSIAGIVDKDNIIDGAKISEDDTVIAVASNGLHTNGYSLVRMLIEEIPGIVKEKLGKLTFIEEIMKPHSPYYKAVKNLIPTRRITGLAHITGGGIKGNLSRIIPEGMSAHIDLSKIRVLPVFKFIKEKGNISDDEMLSTFNCGVGMIAVAKKEYASYIIDHISKHYECYEIGHICPGSSKVIFHEKLNWMQRN